jgi:hypothetical protein
MTYILDTPEQKIYPVNEFQIRSAYPNSIFPAFLNLADLEDFGVYEVTVLPEPTFDPATHKLVALEPVRNGNTYTQGWQVVDLTPEEIPIPPPDWLGFQLAALSTPEFREMVAAAATIEPLACGSLASLLTQVAMGGPAQPLIVAFSQVITAANPPVEYLQQFIGAAQYFKIPEPLIDQLLRQYLPD